MAGLPEAPSQETVISSGKAAVFGKLQNVFLSSSAELWNSLPVPLSTPAGPSGHMHLTSGTLSSSLQAQNKFSWSLTLIPMGFECLQLPAQLHPEATEHIPVWQEPLALGTCDLCSDSSLDGSGVTPGSLHISSAFPGIL